MVAADLSEMAWFAKEGRPPATDALPVVVTTLPVAGSAVPVYRVVVRLPGSSEITCDLPMTTPIWAPATYQPLVQLLLEKLGLAVAKAGADSPSSDLLHLLQEPRAEVLARADGEVSKRLAADFTSATRHEEAALLLGSFALREGPGLFFQIRTELCRMTSHLALARGFRAGAEPALAGKLAEATLTVLYNNQVRALKMLEAVSDEGDAGVWKRALRMRATGDYRIIGESRTQTLWEEIEWFRARTYSVDLARSWSELRLRKDWEPLADWTRVGDGANSVPVGVGHQLLSTALRAELREAGLVYAEEVGGTLGPEKLVDVLNAEPERCVTRQSSDGTARVRVIGWGIWAAFLQRQLCGAIAANFDFMQNTWNVPEDAAKFREEMDGHFSGLRLYSFVRRQMATEPGYYKKAQDEEMALVRRSPQVVPASAWNNVCYAGPFGPIYIPPPNAFINQWHRPNPPPGTAYDPFPRMNQPSLVGQPDTVARLERLHRLAPYDNVITYNLLRIRDGEDDQSIAHIEEGYAAVLDYNPMPSQRIAGLLDGNPAEQERWWRKSAIMDPYGYLQLARLYLRQGREDDAATAYTQWIALEVDEVEIASEASWLIEYLEHHGQPSAATALADRAAATYSSRGLMAKAHLLETRRDYEAALDVYAKNDERYNSPGPLINALRRISIVAPSPRYAAMLDGLLKQHLPGGLLRFTALESTTAPKAGVFVETLTDRISKVGLREGDVVVAMRGYVITNFKEYILFRNFDEDEPYELIIWRGGHYQKLNPLPADYRFGLDFPDYHAP